MNPPALITVRLAIANAFLLKAETGWVVIDSGAPGDGPKILAAAAQHGITPAQIGLILLTHGHVDHFGGAAALRAATGAPIAVHQADAPILRSGKNPELGATSLEGRMLRPFLPWQTTPVEPQISFDSRYDLRAHGLNAEIIALPGHSAGSVGFLLPNGDLIGGDLVRGGWLGGLIAPRRALTPFYLEDPDTWRQSMRALVERQFTTLYVGHGGPIAASDLRARWRAGAFG